MSFDVKNDLNLHNLKISNFFQIVDDPNPKGVNPTNLMTNFFLKVV
jgi:hypothetical protein